MPAIRAVASAEVAGPAPIVYGILADYHDGHAVVSEPVPGRELLETDLESGAVTRFAVEPAADGRRSRVTFETTSSNAGLTGWLERLVAPRHTSEVARGPRVGQLGQP